MNIFIFRVSAFTVRYLSCSRLTCDIIPAYAGLIKAIIYDAYQHRLEFCGGFFRYRYGYYLRLGHLFTATFSDNLFNHIRFHQFTAVSNSRISINKLDWCHRYTLSERGRQKIYLSSAIKIRYVAMYFAGQVNARSLSETEINNIIKKIFIPDHVLNIHRSGID